MTSRTEQDLFECYNEEVEEFDWEKYQSLCDIAEYWDMDE